jgi:hypothetical protein
MKKSLLSLSLVAAGLFAVGAAQAQTYVTPAYSYTTVTTMPLAVGNGPDVPAGADYPYPHAASNGPAPALITTPVVSTHYLATPVVTMAAPLGSVTTTTAMVGTPMVSQSSASATTSVPLRAGEATTMGAGAPNAMVDGGTISIVSSAPLVVYTY